MRRPGRPVDELPPGPHEPYAPMSGASLARLFGADPALLPRWCAEGMPSLGPDRFDAFATCNWLSWGRLDQVPRLQRRWRRYLSYFGAFVRGRDEARRMSWWRHHRLFLPEGVTAVSWWLPEVLEDERQRVHARGSLLCDDVPAVREGELWHFELALSGIDPEALGVVEVALTPCPPLAPGPERDELCGIVEDLVADFRYGYRRHGHGDGIDGPVLMEGSCLDCALALARRLQSRNRAWRLCGGVVARNDIANAHFWLEVELASGTWISIDPSLPAIARMLDEDWRAWVAAYVGGCDARRITLARGPSPLGGALPLTFCSAVPGEAMAEMSDGRELSAWNCIDWVGGWTEGDFTVIG